MSEIIGTISDILKKQLQQVSLEVVGLVPLSNHSDRLVRIQTLEGILQDFDQNDIQGSQGFILQVKRTKSSTSSPAVITTSPPEAVSEDPIYYSDGKLNTGFLMQNAHVLFEAGEHALAKNIYQALLNSGERSSEIYFQVGLCLEAEGNLEAAKAQYEEAITFKPTFEYHQKLASLQIRSGQDLQAAEILERASHLKNLTAAQKFEVCRACGNCWTRSNRPQEAERSFKRALEVRPHADEVRSNLGVLFLQSGRLQEARRHFQDAIASNPKNHQALAGLGECALRDGNKKGAHDYFVESLKIELNNPNALYHLVKCAYELKSYATAAQFLGDYIQNAPVNPHLLYSLAGLQFHLGRIDEARSTAARTLELQPSHVGAKELIGMIEKYRVNSV